jgi:ribosomal protein L32
MKKNDENPTIRKFSTKKKRRRRRKKKKEANSNLANRMNMCGQVARENRPM